MIQLLQIQSGSVWMKETQMKTEWKSIRQVGNEMALCVVEKEILLIDSSHLESLILRCAKILMSNIYIFS